MPVWLQVTLTLGGMVAVVPLFILGNTGSPKAAWEALRGFLLCMAILAAPAALLGAVMWVMRHL